MSGYRLSQGGLIDHNSAMTFSFDAEEIEAFAGDTVASALIASGRQLVARSFKYHRPRGILSAGTNEPNALVTLRDFGRTEPNIQATMAEAFDGLTVRSQNNWPSLKNDLMALNSLLSPFLAAGFYYKTFIGPTARSWMFYEPFIRRAAGLGAAGDETDPDSYDRRNHFCEILVVGGGIAGFAAALAAARSGARVTLADDQSDFGGTQRGADETIDGSTAGEWMADAKRELIEAGCTLLNRTTVFGYYDGQTLGAVERVADHLPAPADQTPRQRYWTIRAKHVVLSTGAFERPLVFPDNDRPGVMLADSVRQYADRFGVACGRRVLVVTNNDSAYGAAEALHRRGVTIAAVVDLRSDVTADCRAAVDRIGCVLHAGCVVRGIRGKHGVTAVAVAQGSGGNEIWIDADCVAMSGGWTPVVHLASQMGTPPVYDDKVRAFLPGDAAPTTTWTAAGSALGHLTTSECLDSGTDAGVTAAKSVGRKPNPVAFSAERAGFAATNQKSSRPFPAMAKHFVDFQNDVTVGDIRQAVKEGYRSVEHLKRYTTLSMATDQGKSSNLNAISLVAEAEGKPEAAVGTTRFRPPYTPVAFGAIAGRHRGAHVQALRRTPMHDWHEANGGAMSPVGLWMRPRAYLTGNDTIRDAYIREASNVRRNVGICDVSTLGKIDVQGPDAAEFLNRVYSNPFLKVPVGKARYGVMLRDDGMVLDDGTSWRLSETRFLMTTTTGGAGAVMQHLERLLAVFWPELRVSVASVTGQWAGMSLAGPNAREVLSRFLPDADVSNDAVPFMGLLQTVKDGIPVLVARLSFSGELAFEVFCGANHGLWTWERLLEAGADFDIMPYGTEALGTLRIEKGHVAGGELDGRVSAHNLGLGGMLSKKKDFFGSRLCERDGLNDPERYELVGLVSISGQPLRAGAHVVGGAQGNPGRSEGFVSSTTFSPVLDKEIALGLVKGGTARIGSAMYAADPVHGRHVPVDVVSAHFFDPDGSRMRM